MKKKLISKIELSYIILVFLISALQIIFLPLINQKLKKIVFSEIPLNEIDYYCKKDKVINSSEKSFISLFCEKINKN